MSVSVTTQWKLFFFLSHVFVDFLLYFSKRCCCFSALSALHKSAYLLTTLHFVTSYFIRALQLCPAVNALYTLYYTV